MSKYEEITESLTRDILKGQYRVGERLPSERDLAARFDANRGAVREAMKKLEQLGIADIQPGGARVVPLHEASLDVIGYLVELDELPDRELVDQIMVVVGSLIQTAAIAATQRMSDEELSEIRKLIRPIWADPFDHETQLQARHELMAAIMAASGNLPVQLIARSLFLRIAPRLGLLHEHVQPDVETHSRLARRLDSALAARDLEGVRDSFNDMSRFQREQMRIAFDAFQSAGQPAVREANGS